MERNSLSEVLMEEEKARETGKVTEHAEKARDNERGETRRSYRPFYIMGTIFLLLFAVVNKESLSAWWSGIQSVINPVLIGFVIAYLINPIYKLLSTAVFGRLKSKKLTKWLSIIITYVILLAALSVLLGSIIPQVAESYKDLESKFTSYLQAAISWANDFITGSDLFNGEYADVFEFIDANNLSDKLSTFIVDSGNILRTVFNYVLAYGSGLIVGVKDALMGLFISVYVLIFKEHIFRLLHRALRAFTTREKYDEVVRRTRQIDGKFGSFIIGKIIDSVIIGILTFVLLALFSIPYAPLVSVIVGVTNVIPVFGPFLGAIPSAFIIFIADPSKALIFIVLIIIIQQLDGNLIGPMILGPSMGLTAFGIVIAITIMGGLWGIAGMLIGVPLFAVIFDIIDENVSKRLAKANDPDFPPSDEKKSEKDSKLVSAVKAAWARSITFVKNIFANKNGGTKNGRNKENRGK